MTLKFKPEDFEGLSNCPPFSMSHQASSPIEEMQAVCASNVAQMKFDKWIKENGKVVYQDNGFAFWSEQKTKTCGPNPMKALLINIEPIEKCSHPKEKVNPGLWACEGGLKMGPKQIIAQATFFQCECGATVQPKEYEEIK